MTPLNLVSHTANHLKNSSPEMYGEFLKALSVYMENVTVAVTNARSDEILVAQGNAQMIRKIVQILNECDKTQQQRPTP